MSKFGHNPECWRKDKKLKLITKELRVKYTNIDFYPPLDFSHAESWLPT